MTGKRQQEYSFTLILSGLFDLTEAVCDALYEAGCGDALLGVRDGVVFLDFDRRADSFQDAVLGAIADVEGAGLGARVVRVEPDELVTMAEIARRAQRTRESIRQLVTGERGPGRFPPPVASLKGRSPIWRWTDVAHWLAEKEASAGKESGVLRSAQEEGAAVAAVNAALDLRRHVRTRGEARQLYEAMFKQGRPGSKRYQETT